MTNTIMMCVLIVAVRLHQLIRDEIHCRRWEWGGGVAPNIFLPPDFSLFLFPASLASRCLLLHTSTESRRNALNTQCSMFLLLALLLLNVCRHQLLNFQSSAKDYSIAPHPLKTTQSLMPPLMKNDEIRSRARPERRLGTTMDEAEGKDSFVCS